MPESSTKAEVEAKLHGTSEAIRGRLDAIQEEISTTGPVVRDWIRDRLREHPLASVGGSLLAGLLVGWLVSGRRKRRLTRAHRRLVENYVDAMRDEVRAAVADGAEVGEAVQEAFRNRTPLIVYGENDTSGGFLRQTFDLALSAALPLFVRSMLAGFVEPSELNGHPEAEDTIGEGIPTGGESATSGESSAS